MAVRDSVQQRLSAARRVQGQVLLRHGAVRLLAGDAGFVEAAVHEGMEHRVAIRRLGGEVEYRCTCHYFRSAGVCHHLWATCMAAQERGWLQGVKLELTGEDGGAWRDQLALLDVAWPGDSHDWPPNREVFYTIDMAATLRGQGTTVELQYRDRKPDGTAGKSYQLRSTPQLAARSPDPEDRRILSSLHGARAESLYGYASSFETAAARYRLPAGLERMPVEAMCRTGRCVLRTTDPDAQPLPLRWDDGPPWRFGLRVDRDEPTQRYVLTGQLLRDDQVPRGRPLADPLMLTGGGLVYWPDGVVAPLQLDGDFPWVVLLRKEQSLRVPMEHAQALLEDLHGRPQLPSLQVPPELQLQEVRPPMSPRVKVRPADLHDWDRDKLRIDVSFAYDQAVFAEAERKGAVVLYDRRQVVRRDRGAEASAMARLHELGCRLQRHYGAGSTLRLPSRKLPKFVATLVGEGWHVEAEGKLYRQPGKIDIQVTSGIDWFELHGQVRFGDQSASLPELLAALRRGESMVRLGDGTYGMLPEQWLKKYAPLAGMGQEEGDHVRFKPTQVALLDALLATQPDAKCDELFLHTRAMLSDFEGIAPQPAPEGFVGVLRPYQCEALGWFGFLRRFAFGGCLADDMGLGKTIQVLAMLRARGKELPVASCQLPVATTGNWQLATGNSPLTPDPSPRPSLVVVPRSLVFNWKAEAGKFTPGLRVLDHSGINRARQTDHFADYDLVITTYGTLRRDVAYLKDTTFEYVILDEAQAIKNASTGTAKAVRLLRGRHRLALSGTPVQNHLGDLWSLFDFLNPGMLGAASVFNSAGGLLRSPDEEARRLLARAVRPFILRRTKEQVAAELPDRLEQTIYCELDATQRRLYDELREHYRASLLQAVARDGINKARIQILEALLRLRQAACHPGLIDKARVEESSAKLDTLLPRLAEIVEEGHKALVFSQFTSLLAIVRARLDAQNVAYEYLDGQTRDRQARVERFQADEQCKLFLISLKAGGLGLNLTAADYVFLLDPWWNPAVEAQAIDRTHRIGQTRRVYACRLIARDTVEEKVVQLQLTKKALADAIITADNSLIRTLGREDLELLLS